MTETTEEVKDMQQDEMKRTYTIARQLLREAFEAATAPQPKPSIISLTHKKRGSSH